MPNYTTNYKFTKPLGTDLYDIQVHNDNMDKVDGLIKTIQDDVTFPLPLEKGGTGSQTAADARNAIGAMGSVDVERVKTIGSNSLIGDYVSWVIPLIALDDDTANTYATGDLFLKRMNGAGGRMTRVSVSCCKKYGETTPYYALSYDGVPSGNGVTLLARTFTYNGIKWFGIYSIITSAAFNGTRLFVGKANRFDDIDMIPVYNTNTSTIINAEIYNSIADEGVYLSRGFTGEPFVAGANGERYKLYHAGNKPTAADVGIKAGTTDLTAGTSALANGEVYLVYE